jgi:hypothetical protein
LYYDDELIQVMTFKQNHLNDICTKIGYNVIGGASKLLNYFIATYNPDKITTSFDRRFGSGQIYKTLGFDLIEVTEPQFTWFKDYDLGEFGFEDISENRFDSGFRRIWNSGLNIYERKL